MKRSKIATFKVKDYPKNEETSKKFKIGDYFTIDFDRCLIDLENKGIIYLREGNELYKFYPEEIYMIRMLYIDKYDVDIDNDKKEFDKFLNYDI